MSARLPECPRMGLHGIPEPELLAALTELQLRVARRADDLARVDATSSGLKLICWLRAEREILEAEKLTEALRAAPPARLAPPLIKPVDAARLEPKTERSPLLLGNGS